MRLLCLSVLHLCSEAVVAVTDRQILLPFLVQIAATAEFFPNAVSWRGEKHRFSSENAFAFRNAEFPDPALVFSVEEKLLTYRQFFGVLTAEVPDFHCKIPLRRVYYDG